MLNGDLTKEDLLKSPTSVATIPFTYGKFISCYTGNDLEKCLERVVKAIVIILADSCKITFSNKQTTSVSNYFKLDATYYSEIMPSFVQALDFMADEELKQNMIIFKQR